MSMIVMVKLVVMLLLLLMVLVVVMLVAVFNTVVARCPLQVVGLRR